MKYISKPFLEKECPVCKNNFSTNRLDKKYCSKPCQDKAKDDRCILQPAYDINNTSTNTTGAISELEVSADLLKKGYEVFRAVSPSCSCDLIAHKNGKLLKIEVRTGSINVVTKTKLVNRSNFRADILAAVYSSGVEYDPSLT
jgi:hypothetical protein